MRYIILSLVFVLSLSACTRVVQAPAPTVPKNHAGTLVALVEPFQRQGFKCAPWTGEETTFDGVDSYLCVGATSILWCGAPVDGPPRCVPAVDWTMPQEKFAPPASPAPAPPIPVAPTPAPVLTPAASAASAAKVPPKPTAKK